MSTTMPTSGSVRRRAKSTARQERVTAIVHKVEDKAFYEHGTIPASSTAVSICSCGARAFVRGTDDFDGLRDFDDAHVYCDEYDEADQ